MKLISLRNPHHVAHNSKGFTLVELLVVMVLSVAFSGLVLSFFIDFWRSTASLQNSSETFVSRQDAGDRLREALNVASGLITQNGLPDVNAHNPDPTDASGTHWQIQHAIPVSVAMPNTGTAPIIYYSAPSTTTSRTFIMNGAQPFSDEFVLYLNASDKKLLLRTIANPGATGNRLKSSCPGAIATATCPVDKTIASDVASVDTRYFSRSGNLINYTSITDPVTGQYIGPDFPSVEVLELTIHLYRKSTIQGGANTTNQTVIRVALRNG